MIIYYHFINQACCIIIIFVIRIVKDSNKIKPSLNEDVMQFTQVHFFFVIFDLKYIQWLDCVKKEGSRNNFFWMIEWMELGTIPVTK